MKKYKIAIVGCGTAGSATAIFLSRLGQQVTVFERVPDPKPVGAGILLQPTGLNVLAKLGLLEEVLRYGAVIEKLYGVTTTGRKVLDLDYKDLWAEYFGLGLHRGTLFALLLGEMKREGARLETGIEIVELKELANNKSLLIDSEGVERGVYDLVVVADGARSILRSKESSSLVKRVSPYPWGAIWAICSDKEEQFSKVLSQVYRRTEKMIGVLPTGHLIDNIDGKPLVSIFWSIPANKVAKWRADGLQAWKSEVLSLWPELAGLLESVTGIDQLTYAPYNDVRMRRWHTSCVIYIGDAAHAMSPQLGQGANLALFDAMILAEKLGSNDSIGVALAEYTKSRQAHIGYYQFASRWLTPFFQSYIFPMAYVRDLFFGLMCQLPYIKTQMLSSLCGIKSGLFTTLPPTAIGSLPKNMRRLIERGG